ncbi:hypothetical protein BDV3_006798 [Batrachochytrium dendrobatidis]|uniref:Phospholipid-transporting ATPase n=1 Tax=Batrachochytrium dendrobatidis (strain JEL423) TaxID=403673 RepID=A0A177WTH0_BATDL|nr:aminophospholipid translocase [Batrachochytrium dendrobatidis]KAK5665761.1 aminophospholipid translocase [Batrachochytrium dendrobatidis]OAJ42700.1 hypothetical protein BDEG_26119 [Batrachochytrium dendrobatidis JEL423]
MGRFNHLLEFMGIVDQQSNPTHQAIGERTIILNDPVKNGAQKYLHNSVTTGKYTLVTFLPKFLFEQFSKYANLFFLLTGTVQLIPGISPTSRVGTILPLSAVLILSAAKETVEDSKRHRQDAEINARLCKVLHGTAFVPKAWRDIVVGDIVRVENTEYFPADLVVLSSSEPDALCYIETSNLDGETNLKIRQGIQETAHYLSPDAVASMNGHIKSELPNNSLYTFEATLNLNGKEVPLDPSQLLLRGAQLRNTRWIYGIVIFTGHETKLMKNSTPTPIKRTKMELIVNIQILVLFILLAIITISCAAGQLVRQLNGSFELEIIRMNRNNSSTDFGWNILTYLILFNNLIPLSLIVTMEFVKYSLGTLINADLDMYYEENDTPATARTSSLVEELGQIDYIFSDKTGTLTRNIMEFKMASIAGIAYAETVPEDKRMRIDEHGQMIGYYDFKTLIEHRDKHENSKLIREFLTMLSVCHTVIPEADETNPGKITYQASSPDEAALVDGASSLGYLFHTRRPKSVTIAAVGENMEYQILNVNEFNSTRKRMSIVVRDPYGNIKLYIKGADTVIYERLSASDHFGEATSIHLEEYANEGLRTLCLAYRDVPEAEYLAWVKIYEAAANTINNRGDALDRAAELIEKELTLLGATAIEDKLQDGVPDTIHTLMEAGIKVWVLTGDRQETAINIGFSCKLVTSEMNIFICNEITHAATKQYLEQKLQLVKTIMGTNVPRLTKMSGWTRFWKGGLAVGKFDKDFEYDLEPLAFVIDGKTLTFALEDDIKDIFLELAMMCKAVICCRVSPLQKALVVKLVRFGVTESVTLAIGDGANDVSMIQAAHVGVGISGMEGLQAARAADFAIAQFRFLRKLLLVHGGWAYARVSKVIVFSFYKNITLYMIQLWFALMNGFSGQTLFETWSSVSTYNVVWTILPPIAIGVFDQFVSARVLDRYPQMYQLGQRNSFYNHTIFFGWLFNSFVHSAAIFFIWMYILGDSDTLSDGRVVDNWTFGSMVYATNLLTVMIKACLIADHWVKVTFISIFGSFIAFMILFPLYVLINPVTSPELRNLIYPMFTNANLWLALILIPVVVNLRDLVWKYYKRTYSPRTYHIAQEIQKYNIPDYRPRMERFRKAVHKIRAIQRVKRTRGFAFSQNEGGQASLIRQYDTTRRKPQG